MQWNGVAAVVAAMEAHTDQIRVQVTAHPAVQRGEPGYRQLWSGPLWNRPDGAAQATPLQQSRAVSSLAMPVAGGLHPTRVLSVCRLLSSPARAWTAILCALDCNPRFRVSAAGPSVSALPPRPQGAHAGPVPHSLAPRVGTGGRRGSGRAQEAGCVFVWSFVVRLGPARGIAYGSDYRGCFSGAATWADLRCAALVAESGGVTAAVRALRMYGNDTEAEGDDINVAEQVARTVMAAC